MPKIIEPSKPNENLLVPGLEKARSKKAKMSFFDRLNKKAEQDKINKNKAKNTRNTLQVPGIMVNGQKPGGGQ